MDPLTKLKYRRRVLGRAAHGVPTTEGRGGPMAVSRELLELPELADPTAAPERELVALLEHRALADHLSGAELARQIGIDQALWSRIRRAEPRTGRRSERFGFDACARIVARFPELRVVVARYLAAGVSEGASKGAQALLQDAAGVDAHTLSTPIDPSCR